MPELENRKKYKVESKNEPIKHTDDTASVNSSKNAKTILKAEERSRNILINHFTSSMKLPDPDVRQKKDMMTIEAIKNGGVIIGYDNNGHPVTTNDLSVKTMDITINRVHDGYGNEFDSTRTIKQITLNNGQVMDVNISDSVGANAKDKAWADKKQGMTLPDGEYYLSAEGLYKNDDDMYDSAKFRNVLKLRTNDKSIPKDIRATINCSYYLGLFARLSG